MQDIYKSFDKNASCKFLIHKSTNVIEECIMDNAGLWRNHGTLYIHTHQFTIPSTRCIRYVS